MGKHIVVEVRSVYGKEMVYPICDSARLFALIANKKTLDHATLCMIEALGFTINQVPKNITWKEVA